MSSDHNTEITIILDGTNYAYWSHTMKNYLKGQKMWKCLY